MTTDIRQPARAYYVRKRWDGDGVYLIHLTRIVRIDAFSEGVWDRLDGRRSLDEIHAQLIAAFPQLQPAHVCALVAHNITVFSDHGWLT